MNHLKCSEEYPEVDGNWWHYNEDDEIEIWEFEPYTNGLIFTLISSEGYYIVSGLKSDCTETKIVIPSRYQGLPVKSIGVSAFEGHTSLVEVVIPDSVTQIRQFAFAYCPSLEKVEISGCVTELGSYAFAYCPALTEITIPSGVTSIPWSLFEGCASLPSVVIPDGVTGIGNAAFAQCYALEHIVIPNTVLQIGDAAFADCDRLDVVYYGGTAAEWKSVAIGSYKNGVLKTADRYDYSETEPTTEGNWWHYADGVPTEW